MKKFLKFLLGLTAVVAAIGGVLYFFKNILMKDYLDDYDDDFDNDLYEEEDEDRDYVTLTPDKEDDTDKDEETEEDEAVPDEMED